MKRKKALLRRKDSGGFTLLEVIISIAILSLIVGGVMACIQACLQATEIVRQERVHQGQCDALQSLLQRGLMTLPSDVVLRYVPADSRNGLTPLRMLSRQPALVFTSTPWQPGRVCESVVIWRRQANGTFTLGVATTVNETASFLPADSLASTSFTWTPLLQDIRNVTLRFYDSTQKLWVDTWDNDGARPALIEMNMEFADSAMPFRGVFWVGSQRIQDTATGRGNPVDAGMAPVPAATMPNVNPQTSGSLPTANTGGNS